MKTYYVFVLASRRHRHISIDVCVELGQGVRTMRTRINRRLGKRRVRQKLVYVEAVRGINEAITRERRLQKMSRSQLNRLVATVNPGWDPISLSALCKSGFSRNIARVRP
jgi:putative endonuclease